MRATFVFFVTFILIASVVYLGITLYYLNKVRGHLDKITQICDEAVRSLREKGV